MEGPKRPRKMYSMEESVVKVVEHALDVSIIEQERGGFDTSGSSRRTLFLSQLEIPVMGEDCCGKMASLVAQSATQELDRVRYCITIYNRLGGACPSGCSQEVWQFIGSGTRDAISSVLVDIIMESTDSHGGGDLFALFTNDSKGSHGDISSMVECVSGWSSDGLSFPKELLQATMTLARSTPSGKIAIIQLLKCIMRDIKNIKRPDEILTHGTKSLDALQTLLALAPVAETVGERLLDEVTGATDKLGSYMEKESVFSSLLSLSTIIHNLSMASLTSPMSTCFTSLNNFPTPLKSDMDQLQMSILDGFHRCQSLIHGALLRQLKIPSIKNNVISWMAAVVSLNEIRAGPKFEVKKSPVASDGFFVNFCMVMLEFCKPFLASHTAGSKLHLISSDYPTSPYCRLDLHNEPCLASAMISTPDRLSQDYVRFLGLGGSVKFVPECFFITSRALHVGLLPATDTFIKTLRDINKELDRKGGQDKMLKDLFGLQLSSGSVCLLDPQLVQNCCEFYITQSVWLTRLIESCEVAGVSEEEVHRRQQQLLSTVPEHGVKDMVRWFLFVLRTRPNLLRGMELTPFIDCCISLLERPDLLPGPVAQSKIITVLLACIGRDTHNDQQRKFTTSQWGGIEGELSAMVQGSPAFRDRLGPALLRTFSAVGVVEGLDVDKEDFDKYTARCDITQLLLYLWGRIDCREGILHHASSRRFVLFLGAIFDTLLYFLNDSLIRLMNIHKVEQEEKESGWSSLGSEEKRRKQAFLANEQRATKGFLTMADKLLQLLVLIADAKDAVQHFCVPPLSSRAAAAIMGFLDMLCGARQAELKVKDPESLGFNPRVIVTQIVTVIVGVWAVERERGEQPSDSFIVSLTKHPDYNLAVVNKVLNVLQRSQSCSPEIITSYQGFLSQLQQLSSGEGGPGDPLAQASQLVGGSSTTPSPGAVADWQTAAEAVPMDMESLRDLYVGALEESRYDNATLQGVHTLEDKAVQAASLDPRAPRVRSILRDISQLEESLPVHPDSSVFVRQDEDRMDLVRVLITGPVGTPYSYGCFVFDIYYPANYPVNPPLVILNTTGNGTVRFNPNLYADGKVCLSLLGTWHGGDSSEKWDPVRSNLMQVLVSIQGLILIPEPIYNEPGYEAMQGTPQGKSRSAQYNAYVQINTVRYAMLEQLRHPPVGFEDTIKIHFMLLRDAVLSQCSKWLRNAVSADHEQKLRRAIDELRTEFDRLL